MTPALSYVIPCGGWRHVVRVADCLLAQEERGSIELVLAGPASIEDEIPPHARESFWGVNVVHADPHALHEARAAGLLAASAPVAIVGETHCYPQPGWARAFIDAFAEGTWDAVGPQIMNANPGTGLSWANLSLDYGPFLRPQRGETDALPGQNTGVRTALLERHRADLPDRMRMPYLFFTSLREAGARLLIEPAARSAHLNVTDRRTWLAERFGAARIFASDRSAGWSGLRRLVYTAGSPVIPLLRALPPLAVGLLASALGEAAGYATGYGDSESRIYLVELDREAYAPR